MYDILSGPLTNHLITWCMSTYSLLHVSHTLYNNFYLYKCKKKTNSSLSNQLTATSHIENSRNQKKVTDFDNTKHKHTFKNHVHILLSLSLNFYLLYLLVNVTEMTRNITRFPQQTVRVSGKSRFYFSRCSKWCSFTFGHARDRFFHWSTIASVTFCDMPPSLRSMRCCLKSLLSRHFRCFLLGTV